VVDLGVFGHIERRSAVPEQVDADPVGEGIVGITARGRAGGTEDQQYRDGDLEIDGYLLSSRSSKPGLFNQWLSSCT